MVGRSNVKRCLGVFGGGVRAAVEDTRGGVGAVREVRLVFKVFKINACFFY